jgi:2-keto-3-deoxy-6-phosphogluconate aldolase
MTATDFIRAGASAIGVGKDLIPAAAIKRGERAWIRELAQRFAAMVKQARSELAA